MIIFIDSGVLGLLTNPKKEGKPVLGLVTFEDAILSSFYKLLEYPT
jgi:hypothetical protein